MGQTEATSAGNSLGKLLQAAFKVGASDIHLKPGAVPMYRIDGDLRPVDFPPVSPEELETFCTHISGRDAAVIKSSRELEFSYSWPGIGRFRGHYYQHLGRPTLALRPIPLTIPGLSDLRLPAGVKRICELTQGLVLVTGATGMGKSTTLASILDAIARTSCRHIITIEDPVEFLLEDGMSCVTQREVGRDVESFAEGLRSALRQDPDVLLIGEARDPETMDVVLHAAQSGHLVLASAHFTDTSATISGMGSMGGRKDQVIWRSRLAEALQAVISQRLLPRADGTGRVLATELLTANSTIKACILDPSKTKNIRGVLERGRAEQISHSLDQSLLELVEAQQISVEVARSAASSPSDLMREINLRRLAE